MLTENRLVYELNRLLDIDPVAINEAPTQRFACNEIIADHTSIPVREHNNSFSFSVLGLFNSLFGLNDSGLGKIIAIVDTDTGKIIRFVINT